MVYYISIGDETSVCHIDKMTSVSLASMVEITVNQLDSY